MNQAITALMEAELKRELRFSMDTLLGSVGEMEAAQALAR